MTEENNIENLKLEIENLRKQGDEYLNGWKRAKADYLNLKKEMEAQNKTQTCGTVLSEYVEDGLYRAEVEVSKGQSARNTSNSKNICYVLLKVGAHKDWRAYIDDKEVSWVQVSPSFMAVSVSEGEHLIEFSFAPHLLRFILLMLSLLTLVGLFLGKHLFHPPRFLYFHVSSP